MSKLHYLRQHRSKRMPYKNWSTYRVSMKKYKFHTKDLNKRNALHSWR